MALALAWQDSAGNVGEDVGPLYPLTRDEGAQRVAINTAALADFTNLLEDTDSSDVIFIAEGRPLHAHRCILNARCEAFRGMFNSAMREGSTACPEVPVLEVSYAAFRCMLHYIYGGAVHVPEELAVELLGLADRYLLRGLKQVPGIGMGPQLAPQHPPARAPYGSPQPRTRAHEPEPTNQSLQPEPTNQSLQPEPTTRAHEPEPTTRAYNQSLQPEPTTRAHNQSPRGAPEEPGPHD